MDKIDRIKAALYMELVSAQSKANSARDEGTLERAVARVEANAIARVLKAVATAESETQIGVYFQADSVEGPKKGQRPKQVGLVAVPWAIGQFDYHGPYPTCFRIQTHVGDEGLVSPGVVSIGFCVRVEGVDHGVSYVVDSMRAFLGGLVDPKSVGERLTLRLRSDLSGL